MPAVQLTLLVIGLVWGAVFFLRGSTMIGCLAWLLSVACFGRSFMAIDLGGVTLSIDRVLLVVLVAFYVVRRSLGGLDPKPLCGADYLLFGLLGWLTLSTFTHDYDREFFESTTSPVWNLIAGYWMPVTVYWIVRQSRLNERSVVHLYGFLLVLGLYLALTGIFEISQQWWLVFPRYIADPEVGIHFGRARGPFGNSIRYGFYLTVCLFAAWMCWLRLSRRQQMLSLPLAALFLAAIFFCYTRSVWLGMAAGALAAAVMTLPGRMRTVFLASATAAGLLGACLLWQRLIFLEREDSGAHAAVSVSNRASHAYVSWKMLQDRPLLGFGFGQYPNEKLAYLYDRNT
ncbi:MAG: O-antigen ligase family protein, partial [Planctomycetota bacterium]|nr:O-antigen ligase family protein [Planctomycetota bacterium]